jgi:hypothetical protein
MLVGNFFSSLIPSELPFFDGIANNIFAHKKLDFTLHLPSKIPSATLIADRIFHHLFYQKCTLIVGRLFCCLFHEIKLIS